MKSAKKLAQSHDIANKVALLYSKPQRWILFLDTLRQRGNNFVERNRKGLPPVLHFDYETVVDGRTLARPVNCAMVRIVPPEGVSVDPKGRPYVIIDPRAGHGPGIGIVRYEPERALATLPILLRAPGDRDRLVTLVRKLLADERMRQAKPASVQLAMFGDIGETLHVEPKRGRRSKGEARSSRKPAKRPSTKRQRIGA